MREGSGIGSPTRGFDGIPSMDTMTPCLRYMPCIGIQQSGIFFFSQADFRKARAFAEKRSGEIGVPGKLFGEVLGGFGIQQSRILKRRPLLCERLPWSLAIAERFCMFPRHTTQGSGPQPANQLMDTISWIPMASRIEWHPDPMVSMTLGSIYITRF